jgi:kelch-like protein 1/4/5
MKHVRAFTTAAGLDGHIYVLGGVVRVDDGPVPVAKVEKYNPESRRWSKSPNMSEEKWGMKAAAWRGKVFVTGGVDEHIHFLDSCEAYDPSTMRWTKVGSMLTARSSHGLAVVNDRLVALGGYAGLGEHIAAVESYDEESDVWRPLQSMPNPPRWDFGCCAVPLAALEPKLREQLHSQMTEKP